MTLKQRKRILDIIIQSLFIIAVALCAVITVAFSAYTQNENGSKAAILNGEYTASDGSLHTLDKDHPFVNNDYSEITFKGSIQNPKNDGNYLIICINNLLVQVKSGGNVLAENKGLGNTGTPGHSLAYVNIDDIKDGRLEITVKNPYTLTDPNAPGIFFNNLVVGEKNALYVDFFSNKMAEVTAGFLVTFLGILTFSFAGFFMRRLLRQNISFALVAFVGGLYLLTDSAYSYMPLFINNPLLCFWLDESTEYFMTIVFMFYILANLTDEKSRLMVKLAALAAVVISITAFSLQLLGVQDLLKSEVLIYFITLPLAAISVIALLREIIKHKSTASKGVLISFIPITAAAMADVINVTFMMFPTRMFMRIGILLTIVIQLINLVLATKKSYKEQLEYENAQSQLLKSKVLIMISQIQPHFLYNSLTSIAQLCEKDPKKAKKATIDFADYLRGNMNSLKDSAPIPFEEELNHLKTYLELEKMRFGDELNIVYDIECSEFRIPSLAVQPLVENAVKHGVGMKEDGGTVTISTREYDDHYEVIVSDDGVGFDTKAKNEDSSKTHIGIENIRERIASMCLGELIIESEIGKGTVSTIKIYKEG